MGVLKVLMTSKGQMALLSFVNDVTVTAIVRKVDGIQDGANRMSGTDFLKDKSIEVLDKLDEAFKDNRNPDSKFRAVSKLMFKDEFATLLAKENALKNVTTMKDGLFDICTQYLMTSQYMGEDGMMSWSTFEKEIKTTVKDKIYEEGRHDGRIEMDDEV